MTIVDTQYISTHTNFTREDLRKLVKWISGLDANLVNQDEGFPIPGKIPVFLGNEWKVLTGGYWQVGDRFIHLAMNPPAGAVGNPTLRLRALLLLCAIEYVVTHLDDEFEDVEKLRKTQGRLLTYLPVREVPAWAATFRNGLYVACDEDCEPEKVLGLAVGNRGEIIAVRNASGEWATLTGETLPARPARRGVTIVEWEG